jgi:hypothetical protein
MQLLPSAMLPGATPVGDCPHFFLVVCWVVLPLRVPSVISVCCGSPWWCVYFASA